MSITRSRSSTSARVVGERFAKASRSCIAPSSTGARPRASPNPPNRPRALAQRPWRHIQILARRWPSRTARTRSPGSYDAGDLGRESRTAEIVCMGRAVAHGWTRVHAFSDPTALSLLPLDDRARVERLRAGTQPSSVRERIERPLLALRAKLTVARTVAIDDAVRDAAAPRFVILGAGLDGRAWRMPELRDVTVYEVDHSRLAARQTPTGVGAIAGRSCDPSRAGRFRARSVGRRPCSGRT